jgi:hypothetical protein
MIEAVRRAIARGDDPEQMIRDAPQGTFADEGALTDQKRREIISRIRYDAHWRGTQGRHMFDPEVNMTWVWNNWEPISGRLKDQT